MILGRNCDVKYDLKGMEMVESAAYVKNKNTLTPSL